MFSVLILLAIFLVGLIICNYFNLQSKISTFSFCFVLGSIFSTSFIFSLFYLFGNFDLAVISFFIMSFILCLKNLKQLKKDIQVLSKNKFKIFINFILFSLFFLLFNKSFSYDSLNNLFLIQTNLYQDFGAHIPFIRAFSLGNINNPEVPFYAGEKLLYHFMFDFYVALLERYGLQINFAMNLLSALTLVVVFNLMQSLSLSILKTKKVGILAFLFVFLGTDLSVFKILEGHGLSIVNIYHLNSYFSGEFFGINIGKYFLNINTYLNQRHLIFGLAIFITVVCLIFEKAKFHNNRIYLCSFLVGLSVFWNVQIAISFYIFLLGLLFLFKEKRVGIFKIIILSLVISLPQLILIKLNSLNKISFNPGFINYDNFSINSFLLFWIWNFGFLIILGFVGFLISNTNNKKIFLDSLPLFLLPNLFQFSQDMFDNHKFFNMFNIFLSLFGAYALYLLFKQKKYIKILAIFFLLLTISSGLLNLLIVKNDIYVDIYDQKKTPFGNFVRNNISQNDILLTNSEIYDPVSLIGKRTFIGRPRYIYLYGGNPDKRVYEKKKILEGKKDLEIKKILMNNNINYIIIYKGKEFELSNTDYFKSSFEKVYEDNFSIIYKV